MSLFTELLKAGSGKQDKAEVPVAQDPAPPPEEADTRTASEIQKGAAPAAGRIAAGQSYTPAAVRRAASAAEQAVEPGNIKDALFKARALAETKNWYKDRFEKISIQRNVLFLITLLSLFFLGGAVWAVAILNASKTFEPFVIEVEEKTGMVSQVDRRSLERVSAEESVQKYMLAKYVRAREGYDPENYQFNYGTVVLLLSSGGVYLGFRGKIAANNEDSPVNLGRMGKRKVQIKYISFLESTKKNRRVAQIRMAVNEYSMPSGALRSTEHFIATIGFEFLSLDLTELQRYINPLGFQVVSYRLDKEGL